MNTSRSKDKCQETGPYRATKLWNNVVHQFRKNMPIGRHRRNMRMYEDCFVASDAVDWLHDYLLTNQDFGENVTRYQTVQLLQKFEKARIFEVVRIVKHKEIFQDNGQLYKFIPSLSPKKRTPLKNKTNTSNDTSSQESTTPRKIRSPCNRPQKLNFPVRESTGPRPDVLPPCQPIQRTLNDDQVEKVWKTVALARLQKLLGKISVYDLVDVHDINARYIMHNLSHVNKNGIVSNIRREDQLPHWIVSAMRCLAHWPEPVEKDLPSYPGFERDVFRVVRDHFTNLDEPLITYELYDVFYNIYANGQYPSPWRSTPRHACSMARMTGLTGDSFLSVENLLSSMTSPKPSLCTLNISTIANLDGIGDVNVTMGALSCGRSEPDLYETLYVTANDISGYDNFAYCAGSDSSSGCSSRGSLQRTVSSNNIKDAEIFLKRGQNNLKKQAKRPSFNLKTLHTHRYQSSGFVDKTMVPTGLEPPRYVDPPPYRGLHRTYSAASDKFNDVLRGPVSRSRSRSYNESLNIAGSDSTPKICQPTSQSIERMKELLQICCLFIPPACRRKLHLLLRLMYKMCQNDQLSLGDGSSIRSTVLRTFYRCIVMCIDESCYDDQTGIQMTAFLMDHHQTIFSTPHRLKQNIDSRLYDMQRVQIRYDPLSPNPLPPQLSHCQRLSVAEFEKQKSTNSEKALYDLLGTIAESERMSAKEKRRRLKQFQKEYPQIYQRRFPTSESAEDVLPRSRSKPLLNGMTEALTKLKAMRF